MIKEFFDSLFQPNDWMDIRGLKDKATPMQRVFIRYSEFPNWVLEYPKLVKRTRLSYYFGVHPRLNPEPYMNCTRRYEAFRKCSSKCPKEHQDLKCVGLKQCAGRLGIPVARSHFIDFDFKDYPTVEEAKIVMREKLIELKNNDMTPTWIVHSGNGLHLYWIMKHPITFTSNTCTTAEMWLSKQFKLIKFFGGDENAKDLSRVLRIPGTFNMKFSTPVRCKILYYKGVKV